MPKKSISQKSNFASSFEEITFYETKERIMKENRSYVRQYPERVGDNSMKTSNLIIPIKIESNKDEENELPKPKTSITIQQKSPTKEARSKSCNREDIFRAEPVSVEVSDRNMNDDTKEKPGVFTRKLTYTIPVEKNEEPLKVYPKKSSRIKTSEDSEGGREKKLQGSIQK